MNWIDALSEVVKWEVAIGGIVIGVLSIIASLVNWLLGYGPSGEPVAPWKNLLLALAGWLMLSMGSTIIVREDANRGAEMKQHLENLTKN